MQNRNFVLEKYVMKSIIKENFQFIFFFPFFSLLKSLDVRFLLTSVF